ncbi:hypothetical protein BCR34DRAFT_620666 [Clohesyomyces aquaticus]|uniref:Uncharacterized protein n=1 Tax=Clohesyomyces aquaticus TaxID=1231657 RepID=A0A1Y1XY73_9PLEO|nr:hypothetical protein BCR34DRAFT_620666 [Clohesyomyces aquaticus]
MGGDDGTYGGWGIGGCPSWVGATGAFFLAGVAAFLDGFVAFFGASLPLAAAAGSCYTLFSTSSNLTT